jgi:hypothetical protein
VMGEAGTAVSATVGSGNVAAPGAAPLQATRPARSNRSSAGRMLFDIVSPEFHEV